jgi:alpha-tubulin suppressor-like RCC1 family protein
LKYGQLGTGSFTGTDTPISLNVFGVKFVAAGAIHSMYIKNDSRVYSTGYNLVNFFQFKYIRMDDWVTQRSFQKMFLSKTVLQVEQQKFL